MTAAKCDSIDAPELRPGVDRNALPPLAEFRRNMYRFFSAVCNGPLDGLLLEYLFGPDFATLSQGFASAHSMDLLSQAAAQGDDDLDELRYEYNNLFIVPRGQYVTPFESVYRGTRTENGKEVLGYLNGPETAAVRRAYRRLGLELAAHKIGPADFIGTEMEFMHQAAEMEGEAWQADDAARAIRLLAVQRSFFEEHLQQWAPSLCRTVMERTRSPLYTCLASLMRDFLAIEARTLSEILKAGSPRDSPVHGGLHRPPREKRVVPQQKTHGRG